VQKQADGEQSRNVEGDFLASRRAENYKYRADDTLFPKNVEFSPGKNRVAHNETVSGPYFDDKIDPSNLANIANYAYGKYRFIDGIYGKDWMHNQIGVENRDANKRLAEQKVLTAANLKSQELVEDVQFLNNLAGIEERKAKEDDMRREYRKQIDDYHKSLARPGENKVEKAQRLREKIRLESDEVDAQRRNDEVIRRTRQNEYNQQLGGQVDVKHGQKKYQNVSNAELEANHTGLNVGNYNGGNKPELMEDLRAQIEEKRVSKEGCDNFRQPVNQPNDFLNYKDRFDMNNLHIVLENRRMMVHPDNSMAKEKLREVHEAELRKVKSQNEEKLRDYEMMNNQVAHEKRILQEEYLVRAGKGADLGSGLQHQMCGKQQKANEQVKENREFKNNFSIGGIKSFGISNIDVRPQLAEKHERQYFEKVDEKVNDHALMNHLDEYDRNKVSAEVERKKQFGLMLNQSLNQQIAITEEKKNRKINAIKTRAQA